MKMEVLCGSRKTEAVVSARMLVAKWPVSGQTHLLPDVTLGRNGHQNNLVVKTGVKDRPEVVGAAGKVAGETGQTGGAKSLRSAE